MKTHYIVSALRNATSPRARLAAWQAPSRYDSRIPSRLFKLREAMASNYCPPASLAEAYRKAVASKGPELSSPEAENPLLWLSSESDPEVMETWAGRKFLDHRGWFQDEFQDETLETYAVRLKRFPRLMFYGVKDSCNGNIRVHLDEWQEIDFSDCEGEWHVDSALEDAAKEIVQGNESATEDEAEESVEYYRKDRIENDIEENKEHLKTLRQSIRELAHELKTLWPSPLVTEYPAAASALRNSLKGLLRDRARIMEENRELAASV